MCVKIGDQASTCAGEVRVQDDTCNADVIPELAAAVETPPSKPQDDHTEDSIAAAVRCELACDASLPDRARTVLCPKGVSEAQQARTDAVCTDERDPGA